MREVVLVMLRAAKVTAVHPVWLTSTETAQLQQFNFYFFIKATIRQVINASYQKVTGFDFDVPLKNSKFSIKKSLSLLSIRQY